MVNCILLEFLNIEEYAINDYSPLGSSFVAANYNDKYLLCFNIYRKQWELPAGGREQNESLREYAVRELYEETSQRVRNLKYGSIKP
ncbi:NUDIX domain-containing protein [Bacillus pseudomycoides]|uniref:NUDIX domain-containing protein n=1 Tax=Bacillus pseudomycoides TaxID=64104 RepID=UPI000BF5DEF7|nr:NUDIX domain-containing protein [Bacillus pseudomycoides]PGF10891.1 NUDIX hydrolase [Bacillus pseudomycoides]